jgi:hypothetical protein
MTGVMARYSEFPPEIQEDLKLFDAHARRETAKAMLNAMDRIIAAGYGKKKPPLYKVKIPRVRKGRLVREDLRLTD